MLQLRDSCSVKDAILQTCYKRVSSIPLATRANYSSCVMWLSVVPSTCTKRNTSKSLKLAIIVWRDADALVLTSTIERLWAHRATACQWDPRLLILNPHKRFKTKLTVLKTIKLASKAVFLANPRSVVALVVASVVALVAASVVGSVSHLPSISWTTTSTSCTLPNRSDSATSSK